MVLISWGCHAYSFAHCVKLVQEIISTFEYFKIVWILDNWIIFNQRFLMICLIICIFFFVYNFSKHSDSLSSVELSSMIMIFDSSPSVEQTYDKVLSTRNSSDLLLSVEQTRDIRICCVLVLSVLTW